MSVNINELQAIINDLRRSTSNIQGISIVSAEGLTICSNIRSIADEEKVAAMSATLLSLGLNICDSFNKGLNESVFVKGTDGYILLTDINKRIVIALVTKSDIKIGVLLWEMEKVKQRISEIFTFNSC